MLVLSRRSGESMFVSTTDGEFFIRVAKILHGLRAAVSIRRSAREAPAPAVEMDRDAAIDLSADVRLTLLDVRGDKVRLGVEAPPHAAVHRLEVYEEIRRANGRSDTDDGLAGAPVPAPSAPKPPSLSVRLTEPPPAERFTG